ncbi:transposase [Algoriphagus sp.]|uniref:transposase n=1 Tax=Algoriphagus sp. TaxID=1872435 RepID=UPI002639B0BF|nr:transposase [Algoriphagus sp.]
MSKQTRRKFNSEFKAKVALEAVRNQQTLAEIGLKYELSPVVISKWKNELLENMASVKKKTAKRKKTKVPMWSSSIPRSAS